MDMSETRNDFGFPVADKLTAATQYAASVRERTPMTEEQRFEAWEQKKADDLQAVINVVNAWKPAKQFKPQPRTPYLVAPFIPAWSEQQKQEHEAYMAKWKTPF